MFTALNPGAFIPGSFGFLDDRGRFGTALTLPPNLDPSLNGVTLHHAYVLYELPLLEVVTVSNATATQLLP